MTAGARVIGYDTRALPDYLADTWDEERRAGYLLLTAAACPLSVDTTVWPSTDEITFPDSQNEFGYAFYDLVARPVPAERTTGVCIAITVYPSTWTPAQRTAWDGLVTSGDGKDIGIDFLDRSDIAEVPKDFQFLGFDVADAFLLSGLTNSGWNPDERVPAHTRWSARLNEHHLFARLEDAAAFAAEADTRVPEHAPFYAFGIHLR